MKGILEAMYTSVYMCISLQSIGLTVVVAIGISSILSPSIMHKTCHGIHCRYKRVK